MASRRTDKRGNLPARSLRHRIARIAVGGIVLLAVLLLALYGLPYLNRKSLRTRQASFEHTATEAVISTNLVALQRFQSDCGRLPQANEGLAALVSDPGVDGWAGPYIRQPLTADMWGNWLQYTVNVDSVGVTSAGPDGKFGTHDDLGASLALRTDGANPMGP